jgi:hypothetical protein
MMKSLKLAAVVSAVMLSVSSLAQADNTDRLNHNFMSKRAYQAPVENNKATKVYAEFEGATLVPEDENSVAIKNERNLKQLKINSIARRSTI